MSNSLCLPIADIVVEVISENTNFIDKFKQETNFIENPDRIDKKIFIDRLFNRLDYNLLKKIKPQRTMFEFQIYVFVAYLHYMLIDKKISFFHGSSFIHGKAGYMFLGPPGFGKTTIINKVPFTRRLSNDIAIVKQINSKFYIFPSPFDKKFIPMTKNKILLKKIFIIKQSKSNKIRALSFRDKSTHLGTNHIALMRLLILKHYINLFDRLIKKDFFFMFSRLINEVEIVELQITKDCPLLVLENLL